MSKICKSSDESAVFGVEVPYHMLYLWYIQRNTCGKSMVECLNDSLDSQAIRIKAGCQKAEERIRVRACVVSKKMSKTSKHKRVHFGKRCAKLSVYTDEIVNVSELSQQVTDLEKRVDEVVHECTKKDEALDLVQMENDALRLSSDLPFNYGRTYDEVADRRRVFHLVFGCLRKVADNQSQV